MVQVPRFGTPSAAASAAPSDSASSDSAAVVGCRPYLQLFKGGKLIFTTAWNTPPDTALAPEAAAPEEEAAAEGPAWAYPADQSIAFAIDAVLQVRKKRTNVLPLVFGPPHFLGHFL